MSRKKKREGMTAEPKHKIMNCSSCNNAKVMAEAASNKAIAAQMFPDVLKKIINEGATSIPRKQAELFSKKVPKYSYISRGGKNC